MKFTLCSSLIIAGLYSIPAFAQPRIETIPGQEISFGRVYKGTKVSRYITVKNAGTDTLLISDVSAQCGCTAAMMSKRRLAPAETGNLSVTFFTAGYEGRVTKHVYIDSNDSTNAELEIELTAEVVQSLRPDPPALTFNVSKPDSAYVSTITFTNTTSVSIRILSVKSDFKDLEITLFRHELMPGEQTELQGTLNPMKVGSYKGTLRLETNHAAQPTIELNVFEIYRPR